MGLLGSYAKFVSDGAIYGKVREMIAEAKEQLIIISPYVDLTDDYMREMEKAAGRTEDVSLVFRRDMFAKYEGTEWFARFLSAGIGLGTVDRLHSKLYVNEREVLLSSMNFNKSSGENSFEVGVVFENDHKIAAEIRQYMEDLLDRIEWIELRSNTRKSAARFGRRSAERSAERQEKNTRAEKSTGHCIKCADPIPLNPTRPYCGPDYEVWAKYKNPDYPGQYCHLCGDEHPATMNRPLCKTCFRKVA